MVMEKENEALEHMPGTYACCELKHILAVIYGKGLEKLRIYN